MPSIMVRVMNSQKKVWRIAPSPLALPAGRAQPAWPAAVLRYRPVMDRAGAVRLVDVEGPAGLQPHLQRRILPGSRQVQPLMRALPGDAPLSERRQIRPRVRFQVNDIRVIPRLVPVLIGPHVLIGYRVRCAVQRCLAEPSRYGGHDATSAPRRAAWQAGWPV
jgi:hypothetical protein